MKIVTLPRGDGKTTELMLWLLEGHAKGITRALIVADASRERAVVKRLQELYHENHKLEYINNAANRVYRASAVTSLGWPHFRNMEVGIDDAEQILGVLLFGKDRPISIMSLTGVPEGTKST